LDFDGVEAIEQNLPSETPPVLPQVLSPENVTEKSCSIEEVAKMKVVELKVQLKRRGLSINGLKEVLAARLKEGIQKGTPIIQNFDENQANTAGDAFSPGAHWELLECDDEYINESILQVFMHLQFLVVRLQE
jgi:hypothetical protein